MGLMTTPAIVSQRSSGLGCPVGVAGVDGTFRACPFLPFSSLEPKHGWAIAKRVQQVSREALQVQQGSLYPALHRLEQQGWIKSEWRLTETGRMAKFYSLTRSGRR